MNMIGVSHSKQLVMYDAMWVSIMFSQCGVKTDSKHG
jgi:hypothetical protein